jgi:hypothetical protein
MSLRPLSFRSRLERIASDAEYFALSVPAKISQSLGTRGPVPVMARVNESEEFLISLFPVGGGRHYLRVKAKIRNQVKIKEGDRVRVQLTVRDPSTELVMPKDLMTALRVAERLAQFKALPIGKKSYFLRWIDQAAKPQTRVKRIQAVVDASKPRRGRQR